MERKSLHTVLKSPLFVISLVVFVFAAYCYMVVSCNIPYSVFNPYAHNYKMETFNKKLFLGKDSLRKSACVLISFDDESMLRMKGSPSENKKQVAKAIDIISECNPKVIAFDLMLAHSQDNYVIAEAVKKAGNVIWVYQSMHQSRYLLDKGIRSASHDVATIDLVSTSGDNVVRTFHVYTPGKAQSGIFLSLPVKAVLLYRNMIPLEEVKVAKSKRSIIFIYKDKKIVFPVITPYGDEVLIHYLYGEEDIPIIPFWRIVEGDFDRSLLKDKIVLLSYLSYSTYESIYSTSLGRMSGGVVMANIINSILYSNLLKPIPREIDIAIVYFVSLFLALLFYNTDARRGFIILISVIFLSISISFVLLLKNIQWNYFDIIVLSPLIYITIRIYDKIPNISKEN